jgi:hypothetical protein
MNSGIYQFYFHPNIPFKYFEIVSSKYFVNLGCFILDSFSFRLISVIERHHKRDLNPWQIFFSNPKLCQVKENILEEIYFKL